MIFERRAEQLTPEQVRDLVRQSGEELTDDDGNIIGYISAPAKIKVDRPYLANGGFLVVERNDETGEYVAVEYDALWDRKTQRHYPAGYSWRVFATADLDEAVEQVLAYMAGGGPAGRQTED